MHAGVGTKFSVRREANDIEVVVTEGQVRVETADSNSAEPLAAGTIAQTSDAGVLLQTKPVAEAFVRLLERGYPLHAEEKDEFVLTSR